MTLTLLALALTLGEARAQEPVDAPAPAAPAASAPAQETEAEAYARGQADGRADAEALRPVASRALPAAAGALGGATFAAGTCYSLGFLAIPLAPLVVLPVGGAAIAPARPGVDEDGSAYAEGYRRAYAHTLRSRRIFWAAGGAAAGVVVTGTAILLIDF